MSLFGGIKVSGQINGVPLVMGKLDSLPDEARLYVRKMVRKYTVNMLSDVRFTCPVDTGRLRASFHMRFLTPDQGEVFTNVQYAPFVEWGHRLRNGGFYPGKYMMTHAWQTNQTAFMLEFMQLMRALRGLGA